jgi:hypothetical protein
MATIDEQINEARLRAAMAHTDLDGLYLRTIKPSAGTPSVPRERLAEAARAVCFGGEPIGESSRDALRHLKRAILRSARRRLVALAMRRRVTHWPDAPPVGLGLIGRCAVCHRVVRADGVTGICVVGDRGPLPAGLYHTRCHAQGLGG